MIAQALFVAKILLFGGFAYMIGFFVGWVERGMEEKRRREDV